MNRLLTLTLIGLAGLLASCGSSVTSTTQPATNYAYLMVVSPTQFSLNAGDWSSIAASVDVTFENTAPKPISPQPAISFVSSDSRVTISPAGEVCAGQWDVRYLTCTPIGALPAGYVTITAYDATRNVSATSLLAVHPRAATITLSADPTSPSPSLWPGSSQPWPTATTSGTELPSANCISQNNQVRYVAHPVDGTGKGIGSCSILPEAPGCVNDIDYTWSVGDSNVAAVSSKGFVVARNPGVTSVYATLNGTVSVPATFVTCPPTSIVLSSSEFTGGTPVGPYSTADLDALTKGTEEYITATMKDANNKILVTSPLNYVTSDPLTGSFSPVLPLTSKLTANTSGRFSMIASCGPSTCNAAVPDFILPITAATHITGTAAGFGYPIYSNAIGATVQGITGSAVLVTGTKFADTGAPAFRMEVYDSESLANAFTVALANLPNSLVVAPNGATAYLGSSAGLMVVNLTTYQASLQTYPILGGISTDVVTGNVLGVSPDSRYVVLSDGTYVFLIDTTGSKVATRYSIPNIDAVTFAPDGSNMWIAANPPAGDTTSYAGVYVFSANTWVKTSNNISTHVKALAWMPDGQSYFASGDQMVNYSTCITPVTSPSKLPLPVPLPLGTATTGPINLDTTVIGSVSSSVSSSPPGAVPEVVGLSATSSGSEWLDYTVTVSSEVPLQTAVPTPSALTFGGAGNVCLSTVTVNTPTSTPAALPCTPTQVTFSPRLEAEFVTGMDTACQTPDAAIHGYNITTHLLTPSIASTSGSIIPLSGGILSDGRKLFVGTQNSTAGTAALHRFDLSTGAATTGTLLDGLLKEDLSVPVELIPSFVAVVPK